MGDYAHLEIQRPDGPPIIRVYSGRTVFTPLSIYEPIIHDLETKVVTSPVDGAREWILPEFHPGFWEVMSEWAKGRSLSTLNARKELPLRCLVTIHRCSDRIGCYQLMNETMDLIQQLFDLGKLALDVTSLDYIFNRKVEELGLSERPSKTVLELFVVHYCIWHHSHTGEMNSLILKAFLRFHGFLLFYLKVQSADFGGWKRDPCKKSLNRCYFHFHAKYGLTVERCEMMAGERREREEAMKREEEARREFELGRGQPRNENGEFRRGNEEV